MRCLAALAFATSLAAMDLHLSGYGPDIHAATFAEGILTLGAASPAGPNPSFVARHPTLPRLYAVSESGDGKVRAFRIADDGALTRTGEQTSGGKGPCHVSVSPDGRWVLAANYGSGHVVVLPLDDDGELGAPSDVQQPGVNAHMAITDPSGANAYVPCKGSDWIAQFALSEGRLVPLDPPTVATKAGAGPRHLVFADDGKRAYGINELDQTITAYTRDGDGRLTAVASVPTLPEGFTGRNTTAHIALSVDGRFCYGSNRGHDSIVRYRVAADGSLADPAWTETTDGLKTPRHFALSPDGAFLLAAAQGGNEVLVYAIDGEGLLRLAARTPVPGKPCCVVFAP